MLERMVRRKSLCMRVALNILIEGQCKDRNISIMRDGKDGRFVGASKCGAVEIVLHLIT